MAQQEERHYYIVKAQLTEDRGAAWEPLLEVNVTIPGQYSRKPFKWLRYVAGTILGAEGDLVKADGGPRTVVQYEVDSGTPEALECLVFKYRRTAILAIVDADGAFHATSSRSTDHESILRSAFRRDLVKRDATCVFTADEPNDCIGAHLLPRSKGSEYMATVSRIRGHTLGNVSMGEEHLISSIMDIRNGLLLTGSIDPGFSRGDLAVLRSPNFAMRADDVLPFPLIGHLDQRFTLQALISLDDVSFTYRARIMPREGGDPQPADLRTPSTPQGHNWPTDWPPAYLWDFVYGIHCLRHFASAEVRERIKTLVDEIYYPGGVKTSQDRARRDLEEKSRAEKEKRAKEVAERMERHLRRDGGGGHDCLTQDESSDDPWGECADLVFALWMMSRNTPEGRMQIAKQEEEQQERSQKLQEQAAKRSIQKADNWLKTGSVV